jgi:regulator of protease activity HflC (stomatin/prohibitin superfamily)
MCRRVLYGEPDVLFMISLICRSVVYGEADVAGMVNQVSGEQAGRAEDKEAARAENEAALEAARAEKQAALESAEEHKEAALQAARDRIVHEVVWSSLIEQLAASTAQATELIGMVSVVHREPDL